MTKEQKFFKALQNIFVGAKIEGEGGFINLMRIKSSYYSQIEGLLKEDIESSLKKHPKFKEELFDKLHSFFSRYFTESGSIYFNSTPFHNDIYEKVYTDEKDVILFWKTQMLFYVKTDRIFRSMPIEFEGFKFFFDAKSIENKKANEKRTLVFNLKKVRADGTIDFSVEYSEKGKKTKTDEILKALKRKGVAIKEEELDKAFKVFGKQSEVDYFINKNAKDFLREQFKLWSYQYFWSGAKEWSSERVDQLQILKDIAFKVIDFISQFEDELVKIWNKPKFVKNSNYVITLDKITDKKLVEKLLKHTGLKDQIKEWQELGIVDKKFKIKDIDDEKYKHLPIDTKYFKDLEIEILSLFEDLDNQLDGWLIKSENYQALNTILPKFKEQVDLIYIDPPFNTGSDFIFLDNFQDSSWLALMDNRIEKTRNLLSKQGSYYLHLDETSGFRGRELLNRYFNFEREIIWYSGGATPGFKINSKTYLRGHDTILFYKNHDSIFNKLFTVNKNRAKAIGWLDVLEIIPKKEYAIEVWENGKLIKQDVFNDRSLLKMVEDVWTGIYSFNYSEARESESLSFASNQKPENLLRRVIQTSSNQKSIVLDYFAGSGTTCAVAQKLDRRWVGVEMGDHFNEIYLDVVKIKKTKTQDDESVGLDNLAEDDNTAIVEVLTETKAEKTVLMKKIGALGRMKIVLGGDKKFKPIHSPIIRKPHLSKDINWQGGGFFKYYELEQYEEALANTKYADGNLFNKTSDKAYQDYVFMKDEKMLKAMDIDYKNNTVKIDLNKLYPNIDIAETLSNLTGKWIKKINSEDVEFTDGSKINTKNIDYKDIKPLIWW